jgi:hypothetical protein
MATSAAGSLVSTNINASDCVCGGVHKVQANKIAIAVRSSCPASREPYDGDEIWVPKKHG